MYVYSNSQGIIYKAVRRLSLAAIIPYPSYRLLPKTTILTLLYVSCNGHASPAAVPRPLARRTGRSISKELNSQHTLSNPHPPTGPHGARHSVGSILVAKPGTGGMIEHGGTGRVVLCFFCSCCSERERKGQQVTQARGQVAQQQGTGVRRLWIRPSPREERILAG